MNRTAPIPFEKRTVFDSQGRGDLGSVPAEIAAVVGCRYGPIRLLNGAKAGFGLAHIVSHADRVRQLAGLGFRDVRSYVLFIASDYEAIAKQPDGRLVFLREYRGLNHRLICQWDEELAIWSITTAIPKPGRRELQIVWTKVTA
jgi:hypothetical protein